MQSTTTVKSTSKPEPRRSVKRGMRRRLVLALVVLGVAAGGFASSASAYGEYPYPLALGGTVGPCEILSNGNNFCETYPFYNSGGWYGMGYQVGNIYTMGGGFRSVSCWYYKSGYYWYFHHCSWGFNVW